MLGFRRVVVAVSVAAAAASDVADASERDSKPLDGFADAGAPPRREQAERALR